MTIDFTVYGMPEAKGRPRFLRNGKAYTPESTRLYEQKIRLSWESQSGVVFEGKTPLFLTMTAYFPIPKSASKKKAAEMEGTFHLTRPDADNITKAITDALNGYAFPDDSAVQIDRAWKVYTNGAPRVDVIIRKGEP